MVTTWKILHRLKVKMFQLQLIFKSCINVVTVNTYVVTENLNEIGKIWISTKKKRGLLPTNNYLTGLSGCVSFCPVLILISNMECIKRLLSSLSFLEIPLKERERSQNLKILTQNSTYFPMELQKSENLATLEYCKSS